MLRGFHVLNNNSIPAETHSFSREVESIPIHMIKPNPYQPRKNFTTQGLEELAQSIREYGVIQPITVRKTGPDGYELIAGDREPAERESAFSGGSKGLRKSYPGSWIYAGRIGFQIGKESIHNRE